MNGAKKFKITLIVAVCAAVAVAAFSRLYLNSTLPNHTPGSTQTQEHANESEEINSSSEPKEILLGEETFLTVVQETLGGQLEVADLSAEIEENATVTLAGTVNKTDVAALLETQNSSVSSAYSAVLELLPDSLPLTLKLRLQANGGAAEVVPKSLAVSSMEIPNSVIGEDVFDLLERNLNRELCKQVSQVQSISSGDSGLVVTGT